MARIALGEFGLDKFIARTFDEFFVKAFFEIGIKPLVAVEITRFENGRADREIFARQPHAIRHRTCRMADLET